MHPVPFTTMLEILNKHEHRKKSNTIQVHGKKEKINKTIQNIKNRIPKFINESHNIKNKYWKHIMQNST